MHKKEIDVYLMISNNIKKYRLANKMTQKDLALKSGYSYSYIRRIEGPKCAKTFSISMLQSIALALNIELKYLFDDDDI